MSPLAVLLHGAETVSELACFLSKRRKGLYLSSINETILVLSELSRACFEAQALDV